MNSYRVPHRLGHVVGDEPSGDRELAVFLAQLPDGPPVVLHGPAAMIWLLAADGEADVPGAVGALVGRDREDVADHVTHFLHHLVSRGLLEAHD